jgi:hypothetical protein
VKGKFHGGGQGLNWAVEPKGKQFNEGIGHKLMNVKSLKTRIDTVNFNPQTQN